MRIYRNQKLSWKVTEVRNFVCERSEVNLSIRENNFIICQFLGYQSLDFSKLVFQSYPQQLGGNLIMAYITQLTGG